MIVFGVTVSCLFLFGYLDCKFVQCIEFLQRRLWSIMILCFMQEICMFLMIMHNEVKLAGVAFVCGGSFAGTLCAACISDCVFQQVYHFVWWLAGGAGICLLFLRLPWQMLDIWGIFLFFLLQQGLFARWYGRADCHAFCVCALVQRTFGLSFAGYLVHMLLAFGILIIVQGFRRNISHRGNLKSPVAFLPYIVFSFYLNTFLNIFVYLCKK